MRAAPPSRTRPSARWGCRDRRKACTSLRQELDPQVRNSDFLPCLLIPRSHQASRSHSPGSSPPRRGKSACQMPNLLRDLERICSELFPGKTKKPCFITARRASARPPGSKRRARVVVTGDLPTGRSGRTTGVDARPIMLHYQNIYGRSDPQCCYSIAQGQVPSDHADAWCCAHCGWGADHCPRGNRLAQIWILGRDATFYVLVLGMGLSRDC
jgi:hypothetical protein